MAITILKEPQLIQPAYNEMILAVTSSNISEENFQFVADLNVRGVTISRIKVPVNPDGYGVVDIHRHVQNNVTFDFDPNATGWRFATQSAATYSVRFREEWRPKWDFFDNYFLSGGLVGFIGTASPPFVVGDEIVVAQTPPFTNQSYNGIALITDIAFVSGTPSGWLVSTAKNWQQNTPAEGGEITLSNFRTRLSGVLATSSTLFAFNGVEDFINSIGWSASEYIAKTAPPGDFLTNVPQNWVVNTESNMWLNCFQNASGTINKLRVVSNKGVFDIVNPIASFGFHQVGVGPKQLLTGTASITVVSGSLPVISATTSHYEVSVLGASNVKVIEPITFRLDRKCSRYEPVHLVFLDKLGSFIPYTFKLVSRNIKDITRTDYQQVFGRYAPATNNWNYKTYDRGRKTLDIMVEEEWEINSDWVDQTTSDFLMTLFESPEVYWFKNGVAIAINFTDTTIERKQTINDQIINYTATFVVSMKDNKQRG